LKSFRSLKRRKRMHEDVMLLRIEGAYPRRKLVETIAFRNISEYFTWEYQEQETASAEGVTTMLYMNRRAKIKLIKAIHPEYQVENLNFGEYTVQELSEIWQDDNLLDEILCELIEASPNE
jgi:hypothetical protein